jgi:D-3-phosphoglycerate dehydrogenase
VALEVAEQVVDVLKGELPRYPVNVPFMSAEEMVELRPYIDLAQCLGGFYARTAVNNLRSLELAYSGEATEHDTTLLTAAAIVGLLSPISEEPVNLVNARLAAAERGWTVTERVSPAMENFASLITLRAFTTSGERLVAGTVMRGEPHIVCIDDFWLDFVARGLLLISEHIERPGIIGRMGTLLGEAGISISFVQTGRKERGGPGVMVIGLDDPVAPELLEKIKALPSVRSARVVKL